MSVNNVGAGSAFPLAPAGAGGAPTVGNFTAAIGAATGAAHGPAAGPSVANPFGQLGSDLQSLLLQLGGSRPEVKDASAASASANSTAGLDGHDHHGGGAHARRGSGDLPTDFADAAIH